MMYLLYEYGWHPSLGHRLGKFHIWKQVTWLFPTPKASLPPKLSLGRMPFYSFGQSYFLDRLLIPKLYKMLYHGDASRELLTIQEGLRQRKRLKWVFSLRARIWTKGFYGSKDPNILLINSWSYHSHHYLLTYQYQVFILDNMLNDGPLLSLAHQKLFAEYWHKEKKMSKQRPYYLTSILNPTSSLKYNPNKDLCHWQYFTI